MVAKTAATGPALASTPASFGFIPVDSSSGISPLRTQNRNAVALAPRASVIQLVSPRCSNSEAINFGKVAPPAEMPRIWLNWLMAMRIPEAVMKPATTGWERKLARKPSRKTPSKIRNTPERKARVMAARSSSGDPGAARLPIAAAVISDTTATGPTASARLVPKIAYSTIGAMDAYIPVSAGRPARSA